MSNESSIDAAAVGPPPAPSAADRAAGNAPLIRTPLPAINRDYSNQPSDDNEKIWKGILDRFTQLYEIRPDEKLEDSLGKMFQPIIFRLDLNAADSVDGMHFPKAADFSIFQVEPLLNQAADILDRAIKDHAERDHLAVEAFKLGLDIIEYAENYRILQDEIEAGLFTLPVKKNQSEEKSDGALAAGNQEANNCIKQLLDQEFSGSRPRERSEWAESAAAISAVPYLAGELPRTAPELKPIRYPNSQFPVMPQAIKDVAFSMDKSDWLRRTVSEQHNYEYWMAVTNLRSQVAVLAAQTKSS